MTNFELELIRIINSMNWQEIVVGIIVLGALIYLIRFMRSSVKDHNCSDCGIAGSVEKEGSSK